MNDSFTVNGTKIILINESGLYSLVLSSKLPDAKKYHRWVTSEVLPAIRKHGTYMTPETIQEVLFNPDAIITIATQLKEERERNKQLTSECAALSENVQTWKDRKCLHAMMNSLAARCERYMGRKNYENQQYTYAWNILCKDLKHSVGIDLKIRKAKHNNKGTLADYLTPEELPVAVQHAAAICKRNHINVGRVINKVNASRIE